MESVGAQLLSSLVNTQDLKKFLHMDLSGKLFIGEEEEVFQCVSNHVIKYGVLPDNTTITDATGVLLELVPEPAEFYLEQVENRYTHYQIKKGMLEAQESLKHQNPEEALTTLQDMVLKLTLEKHRKQIVDFKSDAKDIVQTHYKEVWTPGAKLGINLGWPYLDGMTNGLLEGDLVTMIGRPGAGKTYMLLHMAKNAWWEQEKTPLFISMEMKPLGLIHRLTAMYSKTPITYVKEGDLVGKFKDKVFDALEGLKDLNKKPFWIVDGNLAANVNDIALLCRQLNPDVVYVDGAYLLQPSGGVRQKWERIANTCEGLKRNIASSLNIPVIASYQFNRESTKVKKEKVSLQHISGADEIGQLSSIVLGMFQEESIETLRRRKISVLKGRGGEVGEFLINWIFDLWPFMDFDEVDIEKENQEKELQFM